MTRTLTPTPFFRSINADKSLDRYDPATETGNLTDQYLADRGKFLAELIKYNVTDGESSTGRSTLYKDLQTGTTLPVATAKQKITFGGSVAAPLISAKKLSEVQAANDAESRMTA